MTDLPTGPPADDRSAPNGPAPDATTSKDARPTTTGDGNGNGNAGGDGDGDGADDGGSRTGNARRRGSRGGRNRSRPRPEGAAGGLTADAGVRNPSATDPRDP